MPQKGTKGWMRQPDWDKSTYKMQQISLENTDRMQQKNMEALQGMHFLSLNCT
jgi:hypothetical protein